MTDNNWLNMTPYERNHHNIGVAKQYYDQWEDEFNRDHRAGNTAALIIVLGLLLALALVAGLVLWAI